MIHDLFSSHPAGRPLSVRPLTPISRDTIFTALHALHTVIYIHCTHAWIQLILWNLPKLIIIFNLDATTTSAISCHSVSQAVDS